MSKMGEFWFDDKNDLDKVVDYMSTTFEEYQANYGVVGFGVVGTSILINFVENTPMRETYQRFFVKFFDDVICGIGVVERMDFYSEDNIMFQMYQNTANFYTLATIEYLNEASSDTIENISKRVQYVTSIVEQNKVPKLVEALKVLHKEFASLGIETGDKLNAVLGDTLH